MGEIIKKQDSRRTFIDTIVKLAEKDDRVILVVPDVGFLYIDEFQKRFPKRYFNLGVTEQSTVLVASAMALDGWKPFVYTMINFALFRPGEMVRNGMVCHNAPVTLLGVKGSSSYKFLGFSHNMIHEREDFNFCDNIGLAWHEPKSNQEVEAAVLSSYESGKPNYIRLQ